MIEDRISCISTSGIVSAHKSRTCTVTVCSCTVHRQPRCVRIRHAANTSVRRGQFSRTVSPSQSSVPARMGRALFFAPWRKISPSSGLPPSITSFCKLHHLFLFSVYAVSTELVKCSFAVPAGYRLDWEVLQQKIMYKEKISLKNLSTSFAGPPLLSGEAYFYSYYLLFRSYLDFAF